MSILSKIIAAIGWSPIGKALLIHIDETAFPALVDKTIRGSLTDLISDNVAIITLDTSIQINGSEVCCIRAYTIPDIMASTFIDSHLDLLPPILPLMLMD